VNIINLATPIMGSYTVMIFTTTVEILLVRTDSIWRSHQTPIFILPARLGGDEKYNMHGNLGLKCN
jgi:hypothetical protein